MLITSYLLSLHLNISAFGRVTIRKYFSKNFSLNTKLHVSKKRLDLLPVYTSAIFVLFLS